MVTNQQLFDEGKFIDQWWLNSEEVVVVVEWEGKLYKIVTARDNSAVRNPDKAALPHSYERI